MSFFKEVEGEAAIIVQNGVFKQVPLYTRDGYLFAKVGSGFVRIYADGSTTVSKMRLDFMSWSGPLFRDKLGKLCTAEVPDAIQLPQNDSQRLLGAPQG